MIKILQNQELDQVYHTIIYGIQPARKRDCFHNTLFRLFLAAYGYEVFTARSGAEGLAIFEAHHPQIVFTDIKMPGMDGLAVLKEVRSLDRTSQIIVITGHGDLEKAMEALDLDAGFSINRAGTGRLSFTTVSAPKKGSRAPEVGRALDQERNLRKTASLKVPAKNKHDIVFHPVLLLE